jgi:hypothetical protein
MFIDAEYSMSTTPGREGNISLKFINNSGKSLCWKLDMFYFPNCWSS